MRVEEERMKESGMDKLIEYLNEYLDDGQERLYACYPLDEDFDKFFHTKDGEGTIEEAQVISKKFGFIKWLVDNDKIDVDEINCQKIPYYSYIDEEGYVSFKHFGFYEQLLMLLSISDNPIEFLISILKIS